MDYEITVSMEDIQKEQQQQAAKFKQAEKELMVQYPSAFDRIDKLNEACIEIHASYDKIQKATAPSEEIKSTAMAVVKGEVEWIERLIHETMKEWWNS